MSLHQQRLNSEFIRVLSEAMREIKDPRMSQMASITNAQLTKDLKHAKIFVSIFDKDPVIKEESIAILNAAQGVLGHFMNNKIKMRRIPQMRFVLDESIEYSVHISKLIDQINSEKKPEPTLAKEATEDEIVQSKAMERETEHKAEVETVHE